MRALLEKKRLNVLTLLQHGRSTCEVSKVLGISQSMCFNLCRECVPLVKPSRGGRPNNITTARRRACVKAITIGRLDNVADVRNALSKHLNVVVSTNIVRHVLHEVGLGSLEKHKKPFLTARMCFASWNLLNVIKIGLSMIYIGWFLVMRLRSVDAHA